MPEHSSQQPVTPEEIFLLLEDVVRVGIHVRDQLHILNTHLATHPPTPQSHHNGRTVEEIAADTPVL